MIGEKMPLKAKRTAVRKVAVRAAALKIPTGAPAAKMPRISMAEKLLRYWAPCVMLIGTETPKRALVSKAVCARRSKSCGKSFLR
jgi:hypothetical protein